MGDQEESIVYSPEELAEIDKVLGSLPVDELPRGKTIPVPSTMDDIAAVTDDRAESDDEDELSTLMDEGEREVPPGETDEVVDVTDLIRDFGDEEEPSVRDEFSSELDSLVPSADVEEIPDIDTGVFPEVSGSPAEIDETIPGEISGFDDFEARPARPARPARDLSTLDELEELTSLDAPPPSGDKDVFSGADDFGDMDISGDRGVSLSDGGSDDVPDLSDMSMGRSADIPEVDAGDIPDIDLDSLPDFAEKADEPLRADYSDAEELSLDSLDTLDISSADEVEDISDLDSPPSPRGRDILVDDIDTGFDIKGIDEIEHVAATEEIPDVDDEPPPPRKPRRQEPERAEAPADGEIELTDRELKKLKTAVALFHPAVRKAVTGAIVDETLSPGDQRQLVDMIIGSKPEDNIRRFLEKKLGIVIDVSRITETHGRRVLTSRAEYTREGMERQKQLLRYTKMFGTVAVVTCVIAVLMFQFVYKPAMAKRKIREGVAIILQPGVPPYQRVRNFEDAERIFKIVDEDYVKDYIPGYNAYARAYFDVKEFAYSYLKLKKAYELRPGNVDTLNNLGYFYSRIPKEYYSEKFNSIVPPDRKERVREDRLDVAIRFYNHVLAKEPGNITALYGIGNTYMFQGRYLEARQYYENILKHDRDSVVGYSGLLNLFIERDDFPETVTLHSRIKDRDRLDQLDPALLAKLAWYYMSKKRTDDLNIRVDYGVRSDKYKDIADNPYPAVRAVLNVLADKHPDYPPLYTHMAMLARDTGNYKLMREYLNVAIHKEPNFYAAHHLKGSYHLLTKEPVEAYGSLKAALKAYQSPPDFTHSDFYKETESIGTTYGLMGNVFYYYFDRVRSRFRFSDDLEEVVVDSELEQKANDGISQEYYEKAISLGDKSSEVFYNLGRLYYRRGLYGKAMESWLNLYDDFIARPELMLALGNAFYRMNNLESGKGEYLRLISVLERESEKVRVPSQQKTEHVKVFQTLSTTYNNLGVIYQVQGDEVKANLCYWRSIENAKRLERENEYARVNMSRSFKERREAIVPLLDDDIPFSLNIYRADMR